MRKFLCILFFVVMVVSMVACGKENQSETDENELEYWEEKYPKYSVETFYINVNGENTTYYWISEIVGQDDIVAWTKTDLNRSGWHVIGDDVVDKDEKWVIKEKSKKQIFSSECVYETEPYYTDDNLPEGDVYYTRTGTKYHLYQDCNHMNSSDYVYSASKEKTEDGKSLVDVAKEHGCKEVCSSCTERELNNR